LTTCDIQQEGKHAQTIYTQFYPFKFATYKTMQVSLSGCLHRRKCIVRDFMSHRGAGEDFILLESNDL